TGAFFGASLMLDRARAYPMVQTLIEDIAKGEIKVVIDREFPLSEANAAHAYIESRQAFGRVLLMP
ncbi:MAG: zinc-binding dehydrogenase, partial [Chloroflexi bacterium]|nr:zinc-binding dehydrogenase [Chloroflexota bacterium]